jgi:Carboxypeptidase regulatory-like domain
MENGRTKLAAGLIAALVLSAPSAYSAPAIKLSGSIAGYVRNASGVPQMGATVLLFNKSERLLQRSLTNERGIFGFDSLKPESYSIRISLASFMPAVRESILVQPGMQSLLYVDLASVLSSIELVYAAPGQGALMSNDWMWTLKGSAATRSVLRLLPDFSASDPSQRTDPVGGMFAETRGLFNLSAGDAGSLGSAAATDLGTAFAVATSFLGRNQLEMSGNLGVNQGTAMPTAGFRTSYRREDGGPEVAATVQQAYLPLRPALNALGQQQADGAPALLAISLATYDSVALTDNLRMDYGASLNSLSFLGHLNYSNKFARVTYSLSPNSSLRFAVSSGAPPAELMVEGQGEAIRGDDAALAEDVAALAVLPRISLLDGRAALQRSQNLEIGYEKRLTATTFNVSVYREDVSNAEMTVVAPEGAFAQGDLLPDLSSSKSSIVDAGSYQRTGFAASVARALGDRVEIGTSFGRTGALDVPDRESAITTGDELRSRLQSTQRFWASARASAKIPVVGTQVSASYEWMDYSAIMPDHFYMTQANYPQAGLNVRVRQPIPAFAGMPGRLVATAELRNGLAQGYLPVSQGGQQVLLIQTPRVLRGGLSFIF